MASKPRVIAAMSGGVDSAVAAGLLVEAGYDVVGVTMKMYEPTKPAHAKSCCGVDDFDDARRSASILGIPHYVLDFRGNVPTRRHRALRARLRCGPNAESVRQLQQLREARHVAEYGERLGAAFVATGHYARIEHLDDGPHLFRSSSSKDQAYALAQLSPGAALPTAFAARRPRQGKHREHAAAARDTGSRQTRVPGHLLRRRRRLSRRPGTSAAGHQRDRAQSSRRTAKRPARIAASPTIPSVSARRSRPATTDRAM